MQKCVKMLLLSFIILVAVQFLQLYINYLTTDTFANVQIYWYSNNNIMLLENGEYTILVDLDASKQLVSYETKNIIITKEKFNLLKGKKDYTATITFTEDFLNEIGG